MIIGVLNQKGGACKTTTSVELASLLAEQGKRVLLIDTDKQRSSLKWAAARELKPIFVTVGMPHASIHREIDKASEGYDYVIIDGCPNLEDITRSAIMASDMVLMPVQPSPYDIWATGETVQLVKNAQIYKPMLKCAFVITRAIKGTAIGRDIRENLEAYELPILKQVIYQRVVHPEAAISGQTLTEYDSKSDAVEELRSVLAEVLNLMLESDNG